MPVDSAGKGGLPGSPPPGEFNAPDVTIPTVTFTPVSGSGRTPGQSVQVDVVDPRVGEIGGLRRVVILAIYTDGTTELVFNGTVFTSLFSAGSSTSSITNGTRYTCVRSGDGWLDDFVMHVYAFDTGGNEPAANPTTASYDVTGGVGTVDNEAPVITNFDPVSGSSIIPSATVELDVTDDRGLALVTILADYTSGLSEQVWNGSSFVDEYASESTNDPITDGAHFTLARDGDGWLEDFTLRVQAVDGSGNVTSANVPYLVPDGVGIDAHETIVPVVTIVSPPPGNISPDTAFVVEVTDNSGEFNIVVLDVTYPDGRSEAIYDGVDFKPFYRPRSSVQTIPNGFRFSIRRTGGWPASPSFRIDPRDPSNNSST